MVNVAKINKNIRIPLIIVFFVAPPILYLLWACFVLFYFPSKFHNERKFINEIRKDNRIERLLYLEYPKRRVDDEFDAVFN
jgi:fatty acid desaturase